MRAMMILLVMALASAVWAVDEHDHSHDAPPAGEALPELSREELTALVASARKDYKAEQIASTTAFAEAAGKAAGASAAALKGELDEQIKAIEADRYLAVYVAEEDPFEVAGLAEARGAYVTRIHAADEKYVETLRAGLKRDQHGYVGDLMMAELATSTDVTLMSLMMDWYWHHGMLETPPGSFDRQIHIGYRFLELEPKSPNVITGTAWLLWSRWVSWKQDAERMPVGKGGDADALALLMKGREANLENGAYHFDAGMTMWGLARYHDEKYWTFIMESMRLADEHAGDEQVRYRARMTMGHAFRYQKKYEDAKTWYRKALETRPGDEIATRIIGEVEEDEAKAGTDQIVH